MNFANMPFHINWTNKAFYLQSSSIVRSRSFVHTWCTAHLLALRMQPCYTMSPLIDWLIQRKKREREKEKDEPSLIQ